MAYSSPNQTPLFGDQYGNLGADQNYQSAGTKQFAATETPDQFQQATAFNAPSPEPTNNLTNLYQPKDIGTGLVETTQLPEQQVKPPPLPGMPDVDKTMDVAPEFQLPTMKSLVPEGDTQAINEDWANIAKQAPGVTADQTVQGQLQNLFAEGSPILDYAQNLGVQYANSRGLINSSIGAESGAMALFNQAVPIAQADAQIFARRAEQEAAFWQNAGLQAQAANFQSRLQAQQHVESMSQQALQGDINAQLQLQQFGYNWNLNEQQNIHRMELSAFEGDVQARLNLQQLGIDAEKLRLDWGYRVFANDQELRHALQLSKFEDDQLIERIRMQHINTIREIEQSGYESQLADYYNNMEALRRQRESEQQAWFRMQDEQGFIAGQNEADRQLSWEQMNEAERQAWLRMQDEQQFAGEENFYDRQLQWSMMTEAERQAMLRQESEQDWRSGESELDRDLTRWSQLTEQDWRSGESQLDRDLAWEQQQSEQDWRSGESELDRDLSLQQQTMEQDWRSGESALDRELTREELAQREQLAQEEMQLRERLQQIEQEWQSTEASLDRDLTREELAQREALAQEEMELRERLQQMEQDFRSGESQLDRDARADELDQQNRVQWQLQYSNAVDNLGVNLTNEIMNIMNNPNMTAAQQQNAARLAWDRYIQMFENTSTFYASSPLWDPSWAMNPIEYPSGGGGGYTPPNTMGGYDTSNPYGGSPSGTYVQGTGQPPEYTPDNPPPANGEPGTTVGGDPMNPEDPGVGYYDEFGRFIPYDMSEGSEWADYNPNVGYSVPGYDGGPSEYQPISYPENNEIYAPDPNNQSPYSEPGDEGYEEALNSMGTPDASTYSHPYLDDLYGDWSSWN